MHDENTNVSKVGTGLKADFVFIFLKVWIALNFYVNKHVYLHLT